MKRLDELGPKERAIVEERRRTGYRDNAMEHFGGTLEPTLRSLVDRLLPGVPDTIDLASFVDSHASDPIGRGDRPPGVPADLELLRRGLESLARGNFAARSSAEQDRLIGRMRRGEADDELGVPAKEFVGRLLAKALAGYLAHPDAWERIGFTGPAYPNGYSWISVGAVERRHEGFPGASRL